MLVGVDALLPSARIDGDGGSVIPELDGRLLPLLVGRDHGLSGAPPPADLSPSPPGLAPGWMCGVDGDERGARWLGLARLELCRFGTAARRIGEL